jgi:RNA polymerase sigma-70 factor (ECF subfamily)
LQHDPGVLKTVDERPEDAAIDAAGDWHGMLLVGRRHGSHAFSRRLGRGDSLRPIPWKLALKFPGVLHYFIEEIYGYLESRLTEHPSLNLMISKSLHLDQAITSCLTENERSRTERFTNYFGELRPVLTAFLTTRTGGDVSAAVDCLQEVALVLWKKHDPSWSLEDFRRYAFRCADIEALSFHRKRHRLGKRIVYLAPDVIQSLGHEAQELAAEDPFPSHQRLKSLQLCLEALDPEQRELLDARYERDGIGKSVADIAEERGFKIETLYKRLERIRTSLQNCIVKRLKMQNS